MGRPDGDCRVLPPTTFHYISSLCFCATVWENPGRPTLGSAPHSFLGYELGMLSVSGLPFILDSYVASRFSGHTRFFSIGLGILHLFSLTPGYSSFLPPDF